MKHSLLFIFLFGLTEAFSQNIYKIGDKINTFTLVNAVDNSQFSLTDLNSAKAVVIVFTSPSCPYSKLYEERLMALHKEFSEKNVKFIFINPNNPDASPEDNTGEMVKRAKEKSYNFPYLIDSKQQIANLFGATKTPEVFVLKNINGSFVLQYRGAIDDNPQVAKDVSNFYLKEALTCVSNNTTIKMPEKRASGCMIKK